MFPLQHVVFNILFYYNCKNLPIIGLEPIPLVGLDLNLTCLPFHQMGFSQGGLEHQHSIMSGTLYLLSYQLWEWRDSNPQPFGLDLQSNALTSSATLPMPPKGLEPLSSDYKTDILPIELRRHFFYFFLDVVCEWGDSNSHAFSNVS